MPNRAWLFLLVALAACNGDDPSTGPASPALRGAEVLAGPENVLSAEVLLDVRDVDSAWVRWSGGQTPAVVPEDSSVAIPVLGLAAGTSYQFEVLLAGGAQVIVADTLTLTTGALPAWIPAIGATGTDTTPGYVAVSLPNGPVIVDNQGRVVWYRETVDGTLTSFQVHPNNRYTIAALSDDPPGFAVLDLLGRVTGLLRCVDRTTRFHDLYVGPEGDAWIMCDDVRIMDLSVYGGQDSVVTTWTVVQHLDPSGALLWEWNSFDHFAITDLPASQRMGVAANVTHGNGIGLDADGNLLLSFRELNEVTKVDVATGAVLWRLGGLANQFTILGDSRNGFARQHGLRPAGPGQIQMLDNGAAPPSRLVRYVVNPQTLTARLVLDLRDSPTTFTPVGGSSQYYPDGGGLVSFGRAGRVLETDPLGNKVWELTELDGTYLFRVQRIPSLYTPGGPVTPPFGTP